MTKRIKRRLTQEIRRIIGKEQPAHRIARFWELVHPEPTTGCWLWAGRITDSGHGTFHWRTMAVPAHRVVLAFLAQVDPRRFAPGKYVCHKCDVPWCVNPSHLYLGTASQNMLDLVDRGPWYSTLPVSLRP